MAVKDLKQQNGDSDQADPCTSCSFKTCTSTPSKFSKVLSRMVPFIVSKTNSGNKEESIPTPAPPTSQLSRSYELQRIFCYFDENGDGKISASELRRCMQATGEDLSEEEAEEAVRISDSDGDGELGLEDFARLVEAEDEQEKDKNLMDAFRMYAAADDDGRGCITPKSLQRMLRKLGQDRTVDDCTVMVGRFDLDGDGVLSFEEFKIMMQ